jgi:rare lipoprotein A
VFCARIRIRYTLAHAMQQRNRMRLAFMPGDRMTRRRLGFWCSVTSLVLALAMMGWSPSVDAAQRAPRHSPHVQTGQASWYGKRHDGHRTASGEVYDMQQLTAAHRDLPLGTRVLVTNVHNGRSVQVRVNDRGPAIRGRIIDLSYAAAKRLGAVEDGTVPVTVRVLSMPEHVAGRRSSPTARNLS